MILLIGGVVLTEGASKEVLMDRAVWIWNGFYGCFDAAANCKARVQNPWRFWDVVRFFVVRLSFVSLLPVSLLLSLSL